MNTAVKMSNDHKGYQLSELIVKIMLAGPVTSRVGIELLTNELYCILYTVDESWAE